MSDLGFIHRFVPAKAPGRPPLLLLHGTGGDENDLIPLGEQLAPGAALLSPRGQVIENGMPRFFRRTAEGVFDLEDLAVRTRDLAAFIARAREAYGIAKPVALSFSNGGNIAASLLLTDAGNLAGAVLMRARLPFEPPSPPALGGMPVLILSGNADPMISATGSKRLAAVLKSAGADVTHQILPAGHGLTPNDLAHAARFLEQWK